MIYLWCNIHKREDTESFVSLVPDKRREKKVPAAEIAANR